MFSTARAVAAFPSARIPSASGGLPVEVSLLAQLGHGAGSKLFTGMKARQQAHQDYIDAFDEPSAKLAGTDFEKGDPTSLYTFAVGAQGHPFHRHAGHRVFTAISGSAGAQLRFSSATSAQLEQDPGYFQQTLRCVDIPPDCIFCVRFGGNTWHQFVPVSPHSRHPALFALSCHTNELGGELSDSLKQQVVSNAATIPALTESLPAKVIERLAAKPLEHFNLPTIALSLDAPPGSLHDALCRHVRGFVGLIRAGLAAMRRADGFLHESYATPAAVQLAQLPEDSLLRSQLSNGSHHEDMFCLGFDDKALASSRASHLLGALLDGFVNNPPSRVSQMMVLRNLLVRPLGLRTSKLGCPVSSLLSTGQRTLFLGRHSVLDQSIDAGDTYAQVILGADDKHLVFRSCVAVRIIDGRRVELTLGSRVRCRNWFGHLYMAMIDYAHRSYVTPTMLRMAKEYAFDRSTIVASPAAQIMDAAR